MNRTGLKWWQLAIVINVVIATICLFGINEVNVGSVISLAYALASFYLLKFVDTDKIKGYDDVA